MSEFVMVPEARDYHPTNAYWLARASNLAYEKDNSVIEREVAQWGLHYQDCSMSGTQAYLAWNDGCVIVAFRGTESDELEDWMTDARIRLVPGPRGQVHRGFQEALDDVWERLSSALSEIRRSPETGQSLWFTGHSLGAALATLAVARLRLFPPPQPVTALYTFGQPRVGDTEFATRFDSNMGKETFRVVNNNDIVARVPFRRLGYCHVGQTIYFDSDGKRRGEMSWLEKLKDRIEGRFDDLLKPGTDGVKDHAMRDYIACLEKELSRA